MYVPLNVSLADWIRELIDIDKLYRFYKTREWLDLRADVLADHHGECERCEREGRLSKAETVHHEFEVREHPDLALTRFIVDPLTHEQREVLHPLCNRCHNEVHGRTLKGTEPKPQINEERWD